MTALGSDLARIEEALRAAADAVALFTPGAVAVERKAGGSPVTEADRAIDEVLHQILPRDGEGWLSEETADDLSRLERRRVWIVDPLDGTREFVEGLPEWCISIGLVEDGVPVAGGIFNPSADLLVLGATGEGVTCNGEAAALSDRQSLDGAVVLASRSEVRRGEWQRFEGGRYQVKALGSVAYKLALVASGRADVTWTLVPKNEWDVAAGVALVRAAGGRAVALEEPERLFNRESPLLRGLVAYPAPLGGELGEELSLRL